MGAGTDAGRLADLPEGGIEPFGLDESRRCRKPVVMAAQGVSFTVAVELMMAGDIRVASRSCAVCATGSAARVLSLWRCHGSLDAGDRLGQCKALFADRR